jgi:CheY-like chemotaxis protein
VRILVVDDDSSTRYLLQTYLQARGHEIVLAADGQEALDLAYESRPDLLLTDILMPRLDGYQLCMRWRAEPSLSQIPLVFYTATYVESADESFALGLGADAFLRKPMEPHELIRAIEDVARDVGRPRRAQPHASPDGEIEVLREYNERLVQKLEQKVAELHKANADLETAISMLADEVSVKDTLIERLSAEIDRYSK